MLTAQIYSQQSLPQIFFPAIHCKARSAHTIALIAPCNMRTLRSPKIESGFRRPKGNTMAEQQVYH
jgi:hypothetical protein